jgi:hypothetical protein
VFVGMTKDYRFTAPFERRTCPSCNYVSDASWVVSSKVACPQCGHEDFPLLFPEIMQLSLLTMIGYFSRIAETRSSTLGTELVSMVSREIGRAYTSKQLLATAQYLQGLWTKAANKGQAPDIEQLVQRTMELLGLGTAEDAERTWPILIHYTGTVEEHMAMPILTITLLEAMLDHLLETIGSTKATDEVTMAVVSATVDQLSSFKARTEYFRELTGVPLESAVRATTFPKFYTDLTDVRHSRNAFVHGDSYALTAAVAEKALQLAKDAVPLFAELRNKYGIRSNIRSAP